MCLTFVMVLISLILAQQNRNMQSFTTLIDNADQQNAAALLADNTMCGVLQGATTGGNSTQTLPSNDVLTPTIPLPDPSGLPLAMLGMRQAKDGATFSQPPGSPQGFSGTLRLAGNQANNVPAPFTSDGGTVQLACQGAYASVVMSPPRAFQRQMSHRYAMVYSSCFPYGLLAPHGSINIKGDVLSTGCYDASIMSGLPVNMYAAHSITVNGQLNGRAYSGDANVSLGKGGIRYVNWPNVVTPPESFSNGLKNTVEPDLINGLTDLGPLLRQLHQALHQDFTGHDNDISPMAVCGGSLSEFNQGGFNQPTVTSPGNSDLNGSENTFTAGVPFVVPDQVGVKIPFNMVVDGDLVLEHHAVLYVTGNLTVNGSICLDAFSSLTVDGNVTAASFNSYATYFTPITGTSTLIAHGNVNVAGGMLYSPYAVNGAAVPASATTGTTGSGTTAGTTSSSYSPTSTPIPTTGGNPNTTGGTNGNGPAGSVGGGPGQPTSTGGGAGTVGGDTGNLESESDTGGLIAQLSSGPSLFQPRSPCPFPAISVATCVTTSTDSLGNTITNTTSLNVPNPYCASSSFGFGAVADNYSRMLQPLAPYFATVTQLGPVSTTAVPEICILADGSLTLGSSPKGIGLILAGGDVTINSQLFIGVAWSQNGNIKAQGDFYWCPFFADQSVHTLGHNYYLSSDQWHRTAYGQW
jgi:hypothetical protein